MCAAKDAIRVIDTNKGGAKPHYLTLRGGRMTKVAGVAASFAPTLASSVSAIALGAALMLGGQATAQMATTTTLPLANTEDPTGNDAPITITSPTPADTVIGETQPGFGINTSATMDTAISLLSVSGGNVGLVDQQGSNITGAQDGVYGYTTGGNGNVDVTVTGNVTGTRHGVFLRSYNSS